MKLSKVSLALCSALPMFAVAAAPNQSLEEIQVVALRDSSQFAQYAYSSQKLSRAQLAQQQATSVADALKYVSNVDIQGGLRALAQKPTIRGLSGNRVVQVVDGVRQNFDLAHRGSYFVPTSLIQELEVVKGPTSTLWGSGALGGAVAARTANALDLLDEKSSIGAQVHQGYQSANELSETDVAVYGATQNLDWLLQGFYNRAHNLRLGSGRDLADSAYSQKGGMAKFGWQINDANRLELSHRVSQFKQVAPSNNEAENEFTSEDLINRIRAFHRSRPTMQQMLAFYQNLKSELGEASYLSNQKVLDQSSILNYYLNPASNPYLNAQFTFYHNQTVEKETRVVSGLADETKLKTTGFNLRNTSDLNNIALTYGVDYYQDRIDTERGTNATDGLYRANPYHAKSNVTGSYLLTHIPFGERVILSPSVRYDHFRTKGEGASYSKDHWSPAVALTFKATKWLDLTAKYNEAFRAPSLQERFVSGSHFGIGMLGVNNTFVANPELRPETAKNKEINAKFHFDNVFAAEDKLLFNATYFQNDVKDLINLRTYGYANPSANPRDPYIYIPRYSQYQNVANARLRGFELETQYQNARWNLGASYGETRGKDKATHKPLENIAANKVSGYITYALIPNELSIGSRVTHYLNQNRVPENHSQHYKHYTLTDIYAAYTPKGALKNLQVNFAIENVFDRQYQPAFNLMEGAGRNVKINVGYKF